MLPAMSVTSGLPGYADEYYEPFWSACEEHRMVVNLHTGASGAATDTKFLYDAKHGSMLGLFEVFVFTRRPLWFMIFGGVFDRHPDLKVAITENGVQWLPSLVRDMEGLLRYPRQRPGALLPEDAPGDYFERHVYIGGSLMRRDEAEMRHEVGVDRLSGGPTPPPGGRGARPPADAGPRVRRHARGRGALDPGGQRHRPVGLRRAEAPGGGRPVGPTVDDLAPASGDDFPYVQLEPGPPGATGRGPSGLEGRKGRRVCPGQGP